MSLPELSIKRPIFVTCVFLLILLVGYVSLTRMPVDLFPDVTFPVVSVVTVYSGAGPEEIETLVSKPLEDELSTIAGLKTLRSVNKDGVSIVVAEFRLDQDIKSVEQEVRNHVSFVREKLPDDINEPIIYKIDLASLPILQVSIKANLSEADLFDLADLVITPKIQQVPKVGLVDIIGGRKREIQVQLDVNKLFANKISASLVAAKIGLSGKNIPIGKVSEPKSEETFRLIGEYPAIKNIEEVVISFFGNDVPLKVGDIATVSDNLEDEKTITYVNGEKALLLNIYKQSKANTLQVVDGVKQRVEALNTSLAQNYPGLKLEIVKDSARPIRDNVTDVKDSILLGILLTILVVFFFLGNFRSTIITGIAIPNSLLGAFILMLVAGFSVNIMSLLALSLAVGLLIDDAIVVRENIYRHIEMGEKPMVAASKGTIEVTQAVIATTLTVVSVFGSIAFLDGVVGQFFKQFGLTICFVMMISTLDALVMAPMLSAYFAGVKKKETTQVLLKPFRAMMSGVERFQNGLENIYAKFLKSVLAHPLISITASFVIAIGLFFSVAGVESTFLPPQDYGEFTITLEMAPGTSLEAMKNRSMELDTFVRTKNPEVKETVLTVGDREGQANVGSVYVTLVSSHERKFNTSDIKNRIRNDLLSYSDISPKVTDVDMVGAGMRPFNLHLIGPDLSVLEEYSAKVYEKLKKHPALLDPEISHKPGKPEIQVLVKEESLEKLGISSSVIGNELRTYTEGVIAGVYRNEGREYDIRVRLQENQRNIQKSFDQMLVPNLNMTMVPLKNVATLSEKKSAVTINKENRARYINIAGDIAPKSVGMGGLISDINKMLKDEIPLPPGVTYAFVGQSDDFQALMQNMAFAVIAAILIIYLVLASLYESFITPFTIMLVLPLAACGAFFALFVTGESLNIFSMIGCILLLGIATKNSILLVDYANQLLKRGYSTKEAILQAGKTRLRPILMTSFALIMGMVPVAIGLNEASKQRVSMGIAVIGGVVTSTFLSLILIPAVYSYIHRFETWLLKGFRKNIGNEE